VAEEQFSFDTTINRRTTGSMKWSRHGEGVIPLWVADSDFSCAPAISEALQERVSHGVFGYHNPVENKAAAAAVVDWLERRYQWPIDPDWIVWIPGVVAAFNLACQAFSQPGDRILVQEPNYAPLRQAPGFHGRIREDVPTLLQGGRWTLDFEQLEKKAAHPDCSLFLLSNPMNPCGSVLTRPELQRIHSICQQYQVILCSDEIHCDLVLDERAKHIPAATFADVAEHTLVLMAPSKTFNLAGLGAAFAIVPDVRVRARYTQATKGIMPWINVMGMVALEQAYMHCDDWYFAQLDYLRGNQEFLTHAFSQLQGFEYSPQQATYLAWVDATELGVDDVQAYMLSNGVAPSPGKDFGWPEFSRINFACPRSLLERAVERLTP